MKWLSVRLTVCFYLSPQIWNRYPSLACRDDDAWLPTLARGADGRWHKFTYGGFYSALSKLMCAVTRRHSSRLGKFRHVLQTRLGKGSLQASSQMGALLGHGPDTAIRFYDTCNRHVERKCAFGRVVNFLAPRPARQQPTQERTPGEN